MLKRLGKKVLPIIMATMLVASMSVVSTSAVEVATEESTVEVTATEATETSTYTDELSGVKFESDAIALNEDSVFVFNSYEEILHITSLYEKIYDLEVYAEDYDYADLSKTPVTAYLPYDVEGCYVIFMEYETGEISQLEAEYVDGYYKVQMPASGTYMICDYPLVEGDGELIEQTLVDETTGVSVSGLIPTDSKLVVVDIMSVVKDIFAGFEDLESESEDVEVTVNEEALSLLDSIDGYAVYVIRNFDIAKTEGELTVNLPSEFEGYEVRYIDAATNDTGSEEYESLLAEYEKDYEEIESELSNPTISDEELAEKINALIDEVMPVLASEYVDGNYVVNSENSGTFMILPTDTVKVTAEDVKAMREEYASYEEEPTEEPTGVVNTVVTEKPTQVVQQTVVQNTTATQATTATTSSTQGKTVSTGDSRNIPVILAVLGTATAAIVAFRKKRLAK